MTTMRSEAYAKVNFTLEVFGKRVDGYHALRSVVVPVTLSDTLDVAASEDGAVESDSGYPDDLCEKAARALRDSIASGREGPSSASRLGARIHVEKRIPAGGGLGGGSADAAATLLALNKAWGAGLCMRELAEVGATVGSDVPALVFAQSGVPVLMEGRGEKVSPMPELARRLDLVLVNPGVFSSTAEVFRAAKSRVTGDPSILYNMHRALESGDLSEIAASLVNDLEPAATGLHPEIAAAKSALASAGAVGAAMSGSGSTVFGLVPSEAEGRAVAASLRGRGFAAWSAKTHCPVV